MLFVHRVVCQEGEDCGGTAGHRGPRQGKEKQEMSANESSKD
jgi:hypothetical protein